MQDNLPTGMPNSMIDEFLNIIKKKQGFQRKTAKKSGLLLLKIVLI